MTDKKKWSEIVLEERDKGNVVCILLPDEVGAIPVKEIIKQPVDGLLWDLNRSEDVCLSFMDEPEMLHWVNNFAVALVIRELYSETAALRKAWKKDLVSRGFYKAQADVFIETCLKIEEGE